MTKSFQKPWPGIWLGPQSPWHWAEESVADEEMQTKAMPAVQDQRTWAWVGGGERWEVEGRLPTRSGYC